MGFDLDKHDLFRNGVPGFVFLIVLFSFCYANHDFFLNREDNISTFLSVREDNISTFLSVMVIAITLPIGYLLHNIYRGLHICFELNRWEQNEANMVRGILNNQQLANLTVDVRRMIPRDWILNQFFRSGNTVDKQVSWFIESCLYVKNSDPIRERGYHLVSRIHSVGGSMLAIALGIVFYFFYLFQISVLLEHWQIFILISLVWIVIIYLGLSRFKLKRR